MKIDVVKISKGASRKFFAGTDMRTRRTKDVTRYTRKIKHKNKEL